MYYFWIIFFTVTIAHFSEGKVLSLTTMRDDYTRIENKLKGLIYQRAVHLEEQLKQGNVDGKNFSRILRVNSANPQAMGQIPLTYLRQLLTAVTLPNNQTKISLPSDVVIKGDKLLTQFKGNSIGIMTDARGLSFIREKVAEFIHIRDGVGTVAYEDVFLTNGVSGGLELALKLLQSQSNKGPSKVGGLTPVPLYPLYADTLNEYGVVKVDYILHPGKHWSFDIADLETSYNNASSWCNCEIRFLTIINPGNPIGRTLNRAELENTVKFAYKHQLVLLADEVYQFNMFSTTNFTSLHKVIKEMGSPYSSEVEAISLNSISKGPASEIGLRGGYMHFTNIDTKVLDVLFNIVSNKECPNTLGQIGLYALMETPTFGDISFPSYKKESQQILTHNENAAVEICAEINKIEGIECWFPDSGFFLFPKISIPPEAIDAAAAMGMSSDILYALELLEFTGIFVTDGSAFGMDYRNGYFVRIVVPPLKQDVETIRAFKVFHPHFVQKYTGHVKL